MIAETRIGPPPSSADGSQITMRAGRSGETIIADAHARYQEAVLRGGVFSCGTATSGVAPGTTIGTTAAFALTNPLNSGFNLVVLRATMAFTSGTMGTGAVFYLANINTQLALPTGTAITVTNCLLGSARLPVGKPLTTATIATPIILRPFCGTTGFTTLNTPPYIVTEETAGEFIVGPGATLSLHAAAGAGTSPLVLFGMTWEEVPV
jgi:hypothetical protein